MSKIINEELTYIKYLLGYKKGVVISEQNILLEQNEKKYDVIFEKYPKNTLANYGVTDVIVSVNTDGQKVLSFKTKYKNVYGRSLDSTFTCGVDTDPEGGRMYIQQEYQTDAARKYREQNPGVTITSQIYTDFRLDWARTVGNYAKNFCTAIKEVDQGKFSYEQDAKIGEDGKIIYNQKGTGKNNYIEPTIEITTKKVGQVQYWDVTGFGYFPTSKASSNFSKYFVKQVEDKIFANKEIQAAKNNPNKKLTVTVANIRGGASNAYGGPVSSELTLTDFSQVGNPKIGDPQEKGSKFSANKELAKKRATNLWSDLSQDLPKAANGIPIRISKSLKKNITGYNVETGGVDDTSSKRDWTKYPIPGQHVYISMRIELTPTLEPDIVKSKACLWNSTVDLNFGVSSGSKTHSCDYASFKVYANGVYIGNIDLGNGDLIGKDKVLPLNTIGVSGVQSKISTKPTAKGGPVAGYLKITDKNLANKIVAAGNGGEVTITIKGDDWNDYKKRNVDARVYGTHADIPWMKVISPTGKVIYDSLPNTISTVYRCGGTTGFITTNSLGQQVRVDSNSNAVTCPTWTLGSFNPCAKDTGQGQLSTITSTS